MIEIDEPTEHGESVGDDHELDVQRTMLLAVLRDRQRRSRRVCNRPPPTVGHQILSAGYRTLRELASALDISFEFLSRLRWGDAPVSPKLRRRIAELLGIDENWVLAALRRAPGPRWRSGNEHASSSRDAGPSDDGDAEILVRPIRAIHGNMKQTVDPAELPERERHRSGSFRDDEGERIEEGRQDQPRGAYLHRSADEKPMRAELDDDRIAAVLRALGGDRKTALAMLEARYSSSASSSSVSRSARSSRPSSVGAI